jgi:hypothetical protein
VGIAWSTCTSSKDQYGNATERPLEPLHFHMPALQRQQGGSQPQFVTCSWGIAEVRVSLCWGYRPTGTLQFLTSSRSWLFSGFWQQRVICTGVYQYCIIFLTIRHDLKTTNLAVILCRSYRYRNWPLRLASAKLNPWVGNDHLS